MGMIISVFFGLIFASNGQSFDNITQGVLIGFLIGTAIGLLKEVLWDWILGKGNAEFQDFLATAIGSAVGAVLLWLLLTLFTN